VRKAILGPLTPSCPYLLSVSRCPLGQESRVKLSNVKLFA